MSAPQLHVVPPVATNEPDTRMHRFERDLTLVFERDGEYETLAHGFRFRFRIAERDGREKKYRIVLPLSLESIYFEEKRRLVVDGVVYSRRQDNRFLSIPLTRLTGRGSAYPQQGRYDSETVVLLALMERVFLAGMAWSVLEFLEDSTQSSDGATSEARTH